MWRFVRKALESKEFEELIEASEQNDIWTLQSSIISSNTASIRLHENCGFQLDTVKKSQ
jgi:L-amino acid N-acyltransferase YncA